MGTLPPIRTLLAAGLIAVAFGCGKDRPPPAPPAPPDGAAAAQPVSERLVTRRASITVTVRDVNVAAGLVDGLVTQAEGFVTESARTDADYASFAIRVPSARLEGLLDQLAQLGRASQRTVSARDVTDQAFDIEARLANKRALRERFRGLLGSASNLQEVLSLEEQLARLQTDIDSLEGQLQRLRSEVALSYVSLSLVRQTQLGPLGHVFRGLWIGIRKLFVWD